ncbi:hypothetical protein JCM33374_g3674 [Metschnikowia sp. JCM 33374]|nr:hypothetical protein JCM33374_g3674 [Metschnikowia sp. JCM 33374]
MDMFLLLVLSLYFQSICAIPESPTKNLAEPLNETWEGSHETWEGSQMLHTKHTLYSRDKRPEPQLIMESQGYFLARYTGYHEFFLRAPADASLQFGVDNSCVNSPGDAVKKKLAIRASRGNRYSVGLKAGLYYPLKIVYLFNPVKPSPLDFRFKEPQGEFTDKMENHIFQVNFQSLTRPQTHDLDSLIAPGCVPLNEEYNGFYSKARLVGDHSITELDDDFFIEGYTVFETLWTNPKMLKLNISPKSVSTDIPKQAEKEKDSSDDQVPLWYLKRLPANYLKIHYDENENAEPAEERPKPEFPSLVSEIEPLDFIDPSLVYTTFDDDNDNVSLFISDLISEDSEFDITDDTYLSDETYLRDDDYSVELLDNHTHLGQSLGAHENYDEDSGFESHGENGEDYHSKSYTKNVEDWELDSEDDKNFDAWGFGSMHGSDDPIRGDQTGPDALSAGQISNEEMSPAEIHAKPTQSNSPEVSHFPPTLIAESLVLENEELKTLPEEPVQADQISFEESQRTEAQNDQHSKDEAPVEHANGNNHQAENMEGHENQPQKTQFREALYEQTEVESVRDQGLPAYRIEIHDSQEGELKEYVLQAEKLKGHSVNTNGHQFHPENLQLTESHGEHGIGNQFPPVDVIQGEQPTGSSHLDRNLKVLTKNTSSEDTVYKNQTSYHPVRNETLLQEKPLDLYRNSSSQQETLSHHKIFNSSHIYKDYFLNAFLKPGSHNFATNNETLTSARSKLLKNTSMEALGEINQNMKIYQTSQMRTPEDRQSFLLDKVCMNFSKMVPKAAKLKPLKHEDRESNLVACMNTSRVSEDEVGDLRRSRNTLRIEGKVSTAIDLSLLNGVNPKFKVDSEEVWGISDIKNSDDEHLSGLNISDNTGQPILVHPQNEEINSLTASKNENPTASNPYRSELLPVSNIIQHSITGAVSTIIHGVNCDRAVHRGSGDTYTTIKGSSSVTLGPKSKLVTTEENNSINSQENKLSTAEQDSVTFLSSASQQKFSLLAIILMMIMFV